jgi:hypothetical protein
MTEDTNDRFDDLLREGMRAYNRPPDEHDIPLDEMWTSIDAQTFPRGRRATRHSWLGIAAALVIGLGIGRFSGYMSREHSPIAGSLVVTAGADSSPRPSATRDASSAPLDPTTSRYLGQAAALLIALPAEASVSTPDQSFNRRANDLLLTTRLLLDSQSGSDPAMRNLLEDLELVLVQVVRLEKERSPSRRTELELIQQALDQRDVIPRLRSAASEYASDD